MKTIITKSSVNFDNANDLHYQVNILNIVNKEFEKFIQKNSIIIDTLKLKIPFTCAEMESYIKEKKNTIENNNICMEEPVYDVDNEKEIIQDWHCKLYLCKKKLTNASNKAAMCIKYINIDIHKLLLGASIYQLTDLSQKIITNQENAFLIISKLQK
jgi:hypothetical protein